MPVGQLLYSSGPRLMESVRSRVQDLDFTQHQIVVRDGKGQKDRVTTLPVQLVEPLTDHLRLVRRQHMEDLERGYGAVYLPHAHDLISTHVLNRGGRGVRSPFDDL